MIRLLSIMVLTCACYYTKAQVNLITTIAGTDSMGYGGDGGPSTAGFFHYPDAMCLDNFGNLYIVDALNHRIRKIVLSTSIISTVAGNGVYGYSGDGGLATNAQLWLPNGVITDTLGNIFISDADNHRVRKVNISNGIISTVIGIGTAGNSGDGGLAINAQIYYPGGLYFDKAGNLYFPDNFNNNVRKVAPNGIITTIAGNGSLGYTGDGGPATNATFDYPSKAIVDNYGNILISDAFNNVLRKIDKTTGKITTIAGNGTAAYYGNGIPATAARLFEPHGIYIDKQNNIYFAEWGNGTIRKIDSSGIITTVAGIGTQGFSGDGGPATAAQLIPEDMCFDKNGVMYIADFGNQRIRVVYIDKLGIPNILNQGEPRYSIHPNPNDGNFLIQQYLPDIEPVKVKIFDAVGRNMYTIDLNFVNAKSQISLVNYVPGMYLLEITDNKNRIFRFKFVITK